MATQGWAGAFFYAFALLATACSEDEQWTSANTDVRRPEAGIGVLSDLRFGAHDGYERIVFEFGDDTVPGYRIAYSASPVTGCGSGEVVPVEGNARLEVRFLPAQAHDDEGHATLSQRERALNMELLREMEVSCDFEADLAFVFGLTRKTPYRVSELTAPNRVVLDLQLK